MRDALLASAEKTVLLHGDLHHENILKHGDDWLMIDPQGFIGDPVFEVCALILNPIPQRLEQVNVVKIINDRIQHCDSQLGFSRQRIHDWLFVKSILCWAWCLDDNIDPTYFEQIQRLLSDMS